jgi:proline racemase
MLGRLFFQMHRFRTLDAHVAGEAVRLVVDGGPLAAGGTMQEKLAWARKHADRLRQSLMLEPRGHAGMQGAFFTEPVTAGAHAGLLFMHAGGFPSFSGEAVIAAVALGVSNQLIHTSTNELLIDTPAGLVRAHKDGEQVVLTGVPSFVLSAGTAVQSGGRTIRVDIAFGGELYAVVDAESVGVPIDTAHAAELIRAGAAIRTALKNTKDIHGVMFTGPARGAADLRSATVLDGGILKRSPGVGGTCALMAVLDAMGLLTLEQTFVHEGLLGTSVEGRISSRVVATEEQPALIVPLVSGTARLTGRHEFELEHGDRLIPFVV